MRVRQLGARLPVGGAGARRCGQAQRERKDDCEEDENAGPSQLEVLLLSAFFRVNFTGKFKSPAGPQHRALVSGAVWTRGHFGMIDGDFKLTSD